MPGEPRSPGALRLELRSKRDTRELGQALARVLEPGDLVVLEGDLGAGKTFLVQAIAHALGVPHSVPVTSPTFEIVHEFAGRVPVVHADLYRLDPAQPLDELGLPARVGGDAVLLVEWGDRFAAQLGGAGLWVFLSLSEGHARSCELCAHGVRAQRLLEQLRPLLSPRSTHR